MKGFLTIPTLKLSSFGGQWVKVFRDECEVFFVVQTVFHSFFCFFVFEKLFVSLFFKKKNIFPPSLKVCSEFVILF